MDITIQGPKGSGKSQLSAKIWGILDGKRSLVHVSGFSGKSLEATAKTWGAVSADVIVFDGGFNSTEIDFAKDAVQYYRETNNPGTVAIYILQS